MRSDSCRESRQQERGADCGPAPYSVNVHAAALENRCFRRAVWTGRHLQMTLMSIPVGGEIGAEVHPELDQLLRVEEGQALLTLGECREDRERRRLRAGDTAFVPCGTWHNLENAGNRPLKLSSVYAPPQHPRGTVQCTKEDADAAEA
ncbi:MAG: cupin domain-containing protein [Oscillospiraceae bacterium]|nr:cupin domain-containing protein [Oscillospiraceae bacterium]